MKSSLEIWQLSPEEFPASGSTEEKITFFLGYAILAPSAHNTQPWQCKIDGVRVAVYRDMERDLPRSDPTGRQAFISIGAFIYNLVSAAKAFDVETEIDWQGSSARDSSNSVAVIRFRFPAKGASSNLDNVNELKAITERKVNRSRYLNKPLDQAVKADILKLGNKSGVSVNIVSDPKDICKIADIVAIGTRFAFSNPSFRNELANYVVPNDSNRLDGIPGNTANLSLIPSHVLPWLMRKRDIGPSQANQEQARFLSSPTVAVFSTPADDVQSWLMAGFVFEEVALFLTRSKVAFAFSGAAIEPPLAPNAVQKILGITTRPQILVRLGYSNVNPPHSPRYPVADILR